MARPLLWMNKPWEMAINSSLTQSIHTGHVECQPVERPTQVGSKREFGKEPKRALKRVSVLFFQQDREELAQTDVLLSGGFGNFGQYWLEKRFGVDGWVG